MSFFSSALKEDRLLIYVFAVSLGVFLFIISIFITQGLILILVFLIFFSGCIFFVRHLLIEDTFRQQYINDLKKFEDIRLSEIINEIKKNKNYSTFCYKCWHFNHELKQCEIPIQGRKTFIKVNVIDIKKYCLYWNTTHYPKEPKKFKLL